MGNLEDERVLTVAALGRPFRLGMLYDSRIEKVIPGITLWDEATLENKTVQQLKHSDFTVLSSDSVNNKASALELSASVKLSCLSGLLVDIEGAAKYMESKRSSKHQEHITLHYKCTTRAESMTMQQLGQGKVQHPEVFDHGTATHVVTSIVYGAQAFFIFNRNHSSSDIDNKIDGNAHIIVEKIPYIKINGKGELLLSEDEKKITEKFTCKFIGDFLLPENPSSFLDAVKLYKELPTYLGENEENAVPCKVELYPLALIDRKATKLIRQISVNLVRETERFFEALHDLNMKCNDILQSDAAKCFPDFQYQMQEFKDITETYKRGIQKKLCKMLPQIRGGGDEERSLVELLKKMNQSPISISALRSWLQTKNTQIKVLNKYKQTLDDIKYTTEPGDLDSIVMSPENIYTLCLTISVPFNGSQLETMQRYCLEEQFSVSCEKTDHTVITVQHIKSMSMMEVTGVFRDFYNANKTKKGMSFLVAQEFSESNTFHARIMYYKYGKLMSNDYELPSSPRKVKALVKDTTHESVTISWSPPEYGASAITSYVISCCKDGTEQVTSMVSDDNQVTIPGLAANTDYEVRVWGRCEVGDGPVRDAKVIMKSKPASQPEMLTALKVSPTEVLLRWQAPVCVADGCSVEQYIIQQEKKADHWEETLRVASSEFSCKVGIFSNKVSKFRVAASCGSAGLSCESEHCTVDLTKPITCENLKQNICASSVVDLNNPQIYVPELKLVSNNSRDMIDKYEFGERKFGVPEKVIMLVGAIGSGKTTLINGFVNYVFGVEWNDPFRFKMILEPSDANQAIGHTTKITLYTLHHQEGFQVPYTLTIVDIPCFDMPNKEITENIQKLFMTLGENSTSHIDAVGFVANSSLPRLTPTQRYIFDQILSVFGKDIADNIFLLLTFADGKIPQALRGIQEAKIPYKKHFKFNNSALYTLYSDECKSKENDSDEGDENYNSVFWEAGVMGSGLFLEQLKFAKSKSLVLTQDVINERNKIQSLMQELGVLQRLKKEEEIQKEILKRDLDDIEASRNLEEEIEVPTIEKIDLPPGRSVLCCIRCNMTCHADCEISEDNMQKECMAMTDDYCRICPEKCHWSVHRNMTFRFETKWKKETRKIVDQDYEEAMQRRKLTTENLIEKTTEKFNALEVKVLEMIPSLRISFQRLQEIALRPSPVITVQYMDVLIEAERSEAHEGWQARLEQFSIVKEEAEYMTILGDQDFDLFM